MDIGLSDNMGNNTKRKNATNTGNDKMKNIRSHLVKTKVVTK